MIFAVDIGNTNIVIGIFEKGSNNIVCNFRVQSSTSRTTDEYAAIIMRLMESEGVKPEIWSQRRFRAWHQWPA